MQRSSPRLRQAVKARLRALGAALLLLFGAGNALPALHFAVVSHDVCAEHGDLLHEGSAFSHAAPTPAGAQQNAASPADSEPPHDLHEHCGLPATTPQRSVDASANHPVAVAPGRTEVLGSVRAADIARTSVPVLAYAPKLPPPV